MSEIKLPVRRGGNGNYIADADGHHIPLSRIIAAINATATPAPGAGCGCRARLMEEAARCTDLEADGIKRGRDGMAKTWSDRASTLTGIAATLPAPAPQDEAASLIEELLENMQSDVIGWADGGRCVDKARVYLARRGQQ